MIGTKNLMGIGPKQLVWGQNRWALCGVRLPSRPSETEKKNCGLRSFRERERERSRWWKGVVAMGACTPRGAYQLRSCLGTDDHQIFVPMIVPNVDTKYESSESNYYFLIDLIRSKEPCTLHALKMTCWHQFPHGEYLPTTLISEEFLLHLWVHMPCSDVSMFSYTKKREKNVPVTFLNKAIFYFSFNFSLI